MIDTQPDRRTTLPARRFSPGVRTLAAVLITATAVVFCALLGVTSYTYRFALEQREQVYDRHVSQIRSAENLRFLYQQYEQTWRNILLRGHNPQSYQTHLGDFYELERRIQSVSEALGRELEADQASMTALRAFDQEFYQVGQLYRRALRAYNENFLEPQFAADTVLEGVSSDPVQRNTELIGSLERSRHDSHDQIKLEMQRFELSMALFVLLVICGFLLAVYHLSNRLIISPIKRGIALAEDISRGNTDSSCDIGYATTETNQLLLSLQRMQQNINKVQSELIAAKEQAEESNEAKTAFLSRMSHELRTPLHAILGFSQILQLQSDALTPRQKGNIDKIKRAGEHLLELINEVLDLARIDNNKLEISIENIDLSDVVNDCFTLTAPLARDKDIALINRIPDECHYALQADTLRLKQVLINLITNAIKYGFEHGEVILDYKVQPDRQLRIEVIDNGPGVPLDKQHLLFEPFQRLDSRKIVEGTGIGLALTRKLVELMQGSTGVESEPGKGSTFWIQLPLAEIVTTTNAAMIKPPLNLKKTGEFGKHHG